MDSSRKSSNSFALLLGKTIRSNFNSGNINMVSSWKSDSTSRTVIWYQWRNQGETNWQLPIEIFISRLFPSETLFLKVYLLMNWIANVVFCLFRSQSHSHLLISFQYVTTFSTFSAYCQIKNFSLSNKNLAHFAHWSKNPGCATVC